jgi:phosphoglucomutase
MYKIYAESFRGARALRRILADARAVVADALGAAPPSDAIARERT